MSVRLSDESVLQDCDQNDKDSKWIHVGHRLLLPLEYIWHTYAQRTHTCSLGREIRSHFDVPCIGNCWKPSKGLRGIC